ncbi:SRPBCC family protein [Micromonospora profundi]|uniref:SRPBCC family protein n=1 Tax=Micromonospora TaxID=1873 RepID=UPI00339ECFB9
MPHRYSINARSDAAPTAVYDALLRAGSWPLWSPIDSVTLADGRDPWDRGRVGDVRLFRTGRALSRESIEELEPDRRFVYINPSGPFRSYRGQIELIPDGSGTRISWQAEFETNIRLLGPFMRLYLLRFMRRMAWGLATYAERPTMTSK